MLVSAGCLGEAMPADIVDVDTSSAESTHPELDHTPSHDVTNSAHGKAHAVCTRNYRTLRVPQQEIEHATSPIYVSWASKIYS